ncbi:MAG: hypothetical protein MR536_00015 [Prevotella sp.]|nr:hypothetical protein [Prevotella sp.]
MKKLLFLGALALSLGFVSCSDNNDDFIPEVDYRQGAFVLNEGNFSDGHGTLTYINSRTGEVADSIYYKVNGELLGNVCQDMFMADGKWYIISQNGKKDGSGDLLTIVDARTLKKIKSISPAAWVGKNPTSVAVIADHIYVMAVGGIYLYTGNGEPALIANTETVKKGRLTTAGNKVYAMTNDHQVLVISGNKVIKKVAVGGNPSGLMRASDGHLWLSYTGPNTICKWDVTKDEIIKRNALTQKIGAGWGVAPAFGASGNYIYFSNADTIIYQHDFAANTTKEFVKVPDYIPNAKIYYNSLGVDPATGEVYFASFKGWGQDYKVNNTTVFAVRNATVTKKWNFENVNVFPAGVYFLASFQ